MPIGDLYVFARAVQDSGWQDKVCLIQVLCVALSFSSDVCMIQIRRAVIVHLSKVRVDSGAAVQRYYFKFNNTQTVIKHSSA